MKESNKVPVLVGILFALVGLVVVSFFFCDDVQEERSFKIGKNAV